MVAFVVDVSAAMAWVFSEEATPATWALLKDAAKEGLVVPTIWPYEIANVLVHAERRGRIARGEIETFIATLSRLFIEIEPQSASGIFTNVTSLARSQGLTTYDAAYVELAVRRRLPLATRDRQMAAAAGSLGVPLLSTV